MSIVVAALTQAIPLLTKVAIDHITAGLQSGTTDIAPVVWIVIGIFVCDFGQAIITNINGYHGDILAAKLQKLLSQRYYQHVLSLPQRYFDTELTGTIINRLNRGVSCQQRARGLAD